MSKVYFQGPVMYPKIFEETRDKEGFEGANKQFDGVYQLPIGLDADDLAVVKSWNKLYEGKTFPEDKGGVPGLTYITFKRKHKHVTAAGKVIDEWSGPPVVVDAEGNPWDTDVQIGNGSVVTVELDVTKAKGKRMVFVRLERVRVDELVEYEGGDGNYEDVDVPDEVSKKVIPF